MIFIMLDDLGMTRQRRASRLQVINYSVTFLNSFYLHKQFSILLTVGVQLNTMVLVFPLIFSISEQGKNDSCILLTSDRLKQCFTVLPELNRTSQSKFCFPNQNRTEPNM